jgi:hypothetical protein
MSMVFGNGSRTRTFAPTGTQSAFPQWQPAQRSQQPQPQQPRNTQSGSFAAYSPSAAQPSQPQSTGTAYNPTVNTFANDARGNLAYAPPDQRPPPFVQTAAGFDGKPMDPSQFLNQRGAFVQAINDWKAPHAQAFGQSGTPIPKTPLADLWKKAGEMVQGGWTNPFAAQPTMPNARPMAEPWTDPYYGQPRPAMPNLPARSRTPTAASGPQPSPYIPGAAQPTMPQDQGTPYGAFPDADYVNWRRNQVTDRMYRGEEGERLREQKMRERYLRERGGDRPPAQPPRQPANNFAPYLPPPPPGYDPMERFNHPLRGGVRAPNDPIISTGPNYPSLPVQQPDRPIPPSYFPGFNPGTQNQYGQPRQWMGDALPKPPRMPTAPGAPASGPTSWMTNPGMFGMAPIRPTPPPAQGGFFSGPAYPVTRDLPRDTVGMRRPWF